MKKATSEHIPFAPKPVGEMEVVGVNYDLYNLTVSLCDEEKNSFIVAFEAPVGFRVNDEGNLIEFWPACSSPTGWAFRVIEGGWLDQEKERAGFFSNHGSTKMKEYFLTGINECVSVISEQEPRFIPGKAEQVGTGQPMLAARKPENHLHH